MKNKKPAKATTESTRYAVLVGVGQFPTDIHDWLDDDANVRGDFVLQRKRLKVPAPVSGFYIYEDRVEANFSDADTAMRFKLTFGGDA